MATIAQAQEKARQIALDTGVTAGKITLHNLYPEEFEFYMMAFEIEGDKGIEDRFLFPVMPNRIDTKDQKITNVRRTNAGTMVLTDNSFTHKIIQISGTFGRRMRLLFGSYEAKDTKDFSAGSKLEFDPDVKTGYGLIKRLERLYHKSTQLAGQAGKNNNRPFRVYFYNLSYDQKYLVEIMDFSATQSMETNMIWNYSMTLRAIAPLEGLFDRNRVTAFTTTSAISNSVNNQIKGLGNLLGI